MVAHRDARSDSLSTLWLAVLELSVPSTVDAIEWSAEGELAGWLSARTPRHAAAFTEARVFGAAIDQKIVPLDTPLGTAREVAFFPPFTGG